MLYITVGKPEDNE